MAHIMFIAKLLISQVSGQIQPYKKAISGSDNNRGIKHDFPFINICKVPREVLKTEGEARVFQPSLGTLQMLMNDKIMFDRYYCINSANHCENEENMKRTATIFYNLITFSYARTLLKTMHDSGPVQVLIILHVLCVAPDNKHN